jgi:hypothetical protein
MFTSNGGSRGEEKGKGEIACTVQWSHKFLTGETLTLKARSDSLVPEYTVSTKELHIVKTTQKTNAAYLDLHTHTSQ